MKTLRTIAIVALIAAILIPAAVWADDSASAGWSLFINGSAFTSKTSNGFESTDLIAGLYDLSWSGSWTMTMPKAKSGTLQGTIDSTLDSQTILPASAGTYLYKFFYRTGSAWYEIGQLFDDVYTFDNSLGIVTKSIGDESASFTASSILCDGIGVQYGADYYGNGGAVGGTAGLDATAVPEPSSLIAIATGVVGIVGTLKRRRG